MKFAYLLACILSFAACGGLLTMLAILSRSRGSPVIAKCLALMGFLAANYLFFMASLIIKSYFPAISGAFGVIVKAGSTLSILCASALLSVIILDCTAVAPRPRRIAILVQSLVMAASYLLWLALLIEGSPALHAVSLALLLFVFALVLFFICVFAFVRRKRIASAMAAAMIRRFQIAALVVAPFALVANLCDFESQPLSYFIFPIGGVVLAGLGMAQIYQELFRGPKAPVSFDISMSRERFGITGREGDIIEKLLDGMNNRGIAETLFISERTVKSHLYRVFQKTGAKNRVDLIRILRSPR